MSEFFTTNTPDPPHWTLNYCFGVFRSVWVYLGSFHCFMKHCPNRAELVQLIQKFVPRSRVRIFRNKHSRSTPLDLELTFWCVSYYLGAFGAVWFPYEARCKTGRTSAKVGATKSHRNFSQRTHPIHPIGPSTNVLVCFILFGCIRDR